MTDNVEVALIMNERTNTVREKSRKALVDIIRDECGQTHSHIGGEHGICGACIVLIDGAAVRSCVMFAAQAAYTHIRTVGGLAIWDEPPPLQGAFAEHDAFQFDCCTPRLAMMAVSVLECEPETRDQELGEAPLSNLCSFTGYVSITRTVRSAAAELRSSYEP